MEPQASTAGVHPQPDARGLRPDRTGPDRTDGDGRRRGDRPHGRLVTSAALILGLAFVAMSAGPGAEAQI
jgi:hypothetical protein